MTENFALIQTQYKRIFLEGSEWSEFMSKTMEFKTKGMHNQNWPVYFNFFPLVSILFQILWVQQNFQEKISGIFYPKVPNKCGVLITV